MKMISRIYVLLFMVILIVSCADAQETGQMVSENSNEYSILVFSKTEGWRHDSIEAGVEAMKKLGGENQVSVIATEDASYFNEETLSEFDAIVFLNTTLTIFNDEQREAFQEYIQNGGGYAGIHSATDTEYDWPWYNQLAGAYFQNHPRVQTATIRVLDSNHPATDMLSDQWEKSDEWYNFRNFNEDVHVLMDLDPNSYEGSNNTDSHPISWYHDFEGGRSFYTGLGHTIESYSNETFLAHVWGGIEYAMGRENVPDM